MNKAVIYISGTTNETVNNMIVEVLERYCEKHEYEIVALLGENSQAGMSMPMKYSFIGMAEVEDIDAVVTLSSAMVGTADKEVMETIELLHSEFPCSASPPSYLFFLRRQTKKRPPQQNRKFSSSLNFYFSNRFFNFVM